MKYEMLKKKISKETEFNNTNVMVIDTLELIPKNYAVMFTEPYGERYEDNLFDEESMKQTIANEIAKDLIGNMEHEVNPKGLHTYKFSSVIYYKPDEAALYDLLRKEIRFSNELNETIYNQKVILKSPWKLFKQFFKALFGIK